MTDIQRRLLREIEDRKTKETFVQSFEEIKRWSARCNGRFPVHASDDPVQRALAQKLTRLQENKGTIGPKLQKRLDELIATHTLQGIKDGSATRKAQGAHGTTKKNISCCISSPS